MSRRVTRSSRASPESSPTSQTTRSKTRVDTPRPTTRSASRTSPRLAALTVKRANPENLDPFEEEDEDEDEDEDEQGSQNKGVEKVVEKGTKILHYSQPSPSKGLAKTRKGQHEKSYPIGQQAAEIDGWRRGETANEKRRKHDIASGGDGRTNEPGRASSSKEPIARHSRTVITAREKNEVQMVKGTTIMNQSKEDGRQPLATTSAKPFPKLLLALIILVIGTLLSGVPPGGGSLVGPAGAARQSDAATIDRIAIAAPAIAAPAEVMAGVETGMQNGLIVASEVKGGNMETMITQLEGRLMSKMSDILAKAEGRLTQVELGMVQTDARLAETGSRLIQNEKTLSEKASEPPIAEALTSMLKGYIDSELKVLKAQQSTSTAESLLQQYRDIVQRIFELEATREKGGSGDVHSSGDVHTIVERALAKYSADKTGMVDYAMHTAVSGVMQGMHSPTVSSSSGSGIVSFLSSWGRREMPNGPNTMVQHDVSVGKCWPMRGSGGYSVLRLSKIIRPTFISLEHPSNLLLHDYSATPRTFKIWGIPSIERGYNTTTGPEGILLGKGKYTMPNSGQQVQQFPLKDVGQAFQHVKFEITNNYGHERYTCIYRLRVHGQAAAVDTQ